MAEDYIEWPTAEQRIADHLRHVRAVTGWNQETVAAVLTRLAGQPVHKQTVVRIESGRQPPTLEQALLIGQLQPGGLAAALGERFRVGLVPVPDQPALRHLLTDDGTDLPRTAAVHTMVVQAAAAERTRMLAHDLHTTSEIVEKAADDLWGHSPADEIAERVTRRVEAAEDRPPMGSPTWRAYQAHAVRQVTTELRERVAG